MDTKVILAVLVGLIVGAGGALAFSGNMMPPGAYTEAPGRMQQSAPGRMQQSNDAMMMELEGGQGDEFDKAFMAQMIVHHQGAIQMAELALQNAKHEEIKSMARDIISAQNTEIRQMQSWQASWYGMTQPTAGNAGPGGTMYNVQ